MRKETVEPKSIWRHFKGNTIEVICVCKHTEDLSSLVVYTHQKDIWARPIEMFLSEEDVSSRIDNTTNQKYRFERIIKKW